MAAHYQLTVDPGASPDRFDSGLSDVAPRRRSPGQRQPSRRRSASVSRRSSRRDGMRRTSSTRPSSRPRSGDRRGERDAPGPGRDAVVQAVLPLRRRQVARGARFRPVQAEPAKRSPRNDHWHHMYNGDVISMPDKWEYPWYAAWDLAFHVLALTLVDPDFGKQQLKLMLRERYMHPNGQIPAYEWNFGDVNPPVHAWATIFTYRLEKGRGRRGTCEWLKTSFQKLLLNFTWWVNRKDRDRPERLRGRLPGPRQHRGLRPQRALADRRLPGTGRRHRLDGPVLPEHARDRRRAGDDRRRTTRTWRSSSSSTSCGSPRPCCTLGDDTGMWDEEDGFFYDVLRLPDGRAQRLKVRSMVGLLPLCAPRRSTGN